MVTIAEMTSRNARSKLPNVKYDWVLPDTLMGIEVEVDSDSTSVSIHPYDHTIRSWNRHHDGSLNNGYEYTLRAPLAGSQLSSAIAELFAPPSLFYRTFTGSTHIHIDMLEEDVTLDVLRTLVLLVYTLEPVLYAVGDRSREWCGYSNSLKSADSMLLSTLFSNEVRGTFTRVFRRGGALGRYYGLNLAAVSDYGSVEFRYFPTASSAEELVGWINLVQSFKKAALEIGSPDAFKEIVQDESKYNDMITAYFPSYVRLIQDVASWRSVYTMLTKADVVINDSKLATPDAPVYSKVFTKSGRFSSLVNLEEIENSQKEMVKIYSNNEVPNGAEEGEVLVYFNRVYIMHDESWAQVNDRRSDRIHVAEGTRAALSHVLEAHPIAMPDVYAINSILSLGYIPSYEDEYGEDAWDEEDSEY